MDFKNNKGLLVLVIIVNVVIWPIFIVPNFLPFVGSLLVNFKGVQTAFEMKKSTVSTETQEKVDFYKMRDPFQPPREAAAAQPVRHTPKSDNNTPVVNNIPQNGQEHVKRTFTSRFKLKSIFKSKDQKYMATLEESTGYDSDSGGDNGGGGGGVPYSYRFGGQPEPQATSGKTYMVWEGDSVMEETVEKIAEDYLILSKNGLYYKLTFSGGYAVQNAN
jgi:hypothetical protein